MALSRWEEPEVVDLIDTPPDERNAKERLPKSPSSDECCSICLGKYRNKAFADTCMHTFCFVCLREWAKVKQECPLCKTKFKIIIHNILSNEVYDQYHVPVVARESAHHRREERAFRYSTTLTEERRFLHEWRRNRSFNREVSRAERARRQAAAEDRRRLIYAARLRVLHMGSNNHSRFRDISPQFFSANPAVTHRLVPWIRRELGVLFNNHEETITFLTHYILELINNVEIQSEEFHEAMRPFLYARTDHFVHEFANFARSPYDMDAYDEYAQYDFSAASGPPPDRNQPLVTAPEVENANGSDSENSDVEIIPTSNEPHVIESDNEDEYLPPQHEMGSYGDMIQPEPYTDSSLDRATYDNFVPQEVSHSSNSPVYLNSNLMQHANRVDFTHSDEVSCVRSNEQNVGETSAVIQSNDVQSDHDSEVMDLCSSDGSDNEIIQGGPPSPKPEALGNHPEPPSHNPEPPSHIPEPPSHNPEPPSASLPAPPPDEDVPGPSNAVTQTVTQNGQIVVNGVKIKQEPTSPYIYDSDDSSIYITGYQKPYHLRTPDPPVDISSSQETDDPTSPEKTKDKSQKRKSRRSRSKHRHSRSSSRRRYSRSSSSEYSSRKSKHKKSHSRRRTRSKSRDRRRSRSRSHGRHSRRRSRSLSHSRSRSRSPSKPISFTQAGTIPRRPKKSRKRSPSRSRSRTPSSTRELVQLLKKNTKKGASAATTLRSILARKSKSRSRSKSKERSPVRKKDRSKSPVKSSTSKNPMPTTAPTLGSLLLSRSSKKSDKEQEGSTERKKSESTPTPHSVSRHGHSSESRRYAAYDEDANLKSKDKHQKSSKKSKENSYHTNSHDSRREKDRSSSKSSLKERSDRYYDRSSAEKDYSKSKHKTSSKDYKSSKSLSRKR